MTIAPNAMQDLQTRVHYIDRDKAATMIGQFSKHRTRLFKSNKNYCTLPFNAPGIPNCITFKKDAILELLNNTDCIAMRIYPALNNAQQLTFVLVGVDATGENILTIASNGDMPIANSNMAVTALLDEGQASPPYPAPNKNF